MSGVVYVETTIFSFYHEQRTTPGVVAMRQWTREWWDKHRTRYTPVTSAAVLAELDAGQLPHRNDALAMAKALPAIPVEDAATEIADVYIKHMVMPADPSGDALHLALASFHRVDYLLTWNCRHLANANKFNHIRRVNMLLGLPTPVLVTPLELLGEGAPS
ncbi:MAG: type II toxin-antitoxin system VapC family toxin [Planctomycetota bacterium]|nr:type II toxin-antitoxin system VapC family toxin [Planctomycetota bacterium]